jgi:F0F1-type ATP synthase membrane subunit b/b'
VDEEQLLDQLDVVRLNLPPAFQEATEIILHKEEVLLEAEQYAQEIIADAERRAAQILDEMGLIRQAEAEAQRIRQQVQQDCEGMQQQVLAEIDQMRRRAQQELVEMQQMAIAECEEIQRGADEYADHVLQDMEQQLVEMMRIVRNGRQQLQINKPTPRSPENFSPNPNRQLPTNRYSG